VPQLGGTAVATTTTTTRKSLGREAATVARREGIPPITERGKICSGAVRPSVQVREGVGRSSVPRHVSAPPHRRLCRHPHLHLSCPPASSPQPSTAGEKAYIERNAARGAYSASFGVGEEGGRTGGSRLSYVGAPTVASRRRGGREDASTHVHPRLFCRYDGGAGSIADGASVEGE